MKMFRSESLLKNGEAAVDTYSPAFAFIYIFNLIVGVGALSLPKAFSDVGIILGTILLIVLACMSYITSTFMIEAMATANAYMQHQRRMRWNVVETKAISHLQQDHGYIGVTESGHYSPGRPTRRSPVTVSHEEITRLIPPIMSEDSNSDDEIPKYAGKYVLPADDYEIKEKFEMGTMANMFYHPIGIIIYYIVICLYLYGDLAIYAVAIPKSLVVVACSKPSNGSEEDNVTNSLGAFNKDKICFYNITQLQAYYIFLAITALVLSPWTFFNLSKSKYIQLATTIMRNIAFVLLVGLAIIKLVDGHRSRPNLAEFSGFPILFGVSIYSFMCQHSLPGMVTPMRTKKNISVLLFFEFSFILSFYLLVAFTGAFTYPYNALNDIYTLNFFTQFSSSLSVLHQVQAVLGYYLALFPVFTLSTNFPIISITLRENIKALFLQLFKQWRGDKPFHKAINRLVFPLLAIIPAIAIAFVTQNVQILVSVTGAFPGIGVQYVIPVTLAFAGKYMIKNKMGILHYENKHKSPFSNKLLLVFVLVWTTVSICVIIIDDVLKIVHHQFED